MIGYSTPLGQCICGDSLELIPTLEDKSVDLLITSPPFSLASRHKKYSDFNEIPQNKYVDWLLQFFDKVKPKIKDSGSIVVDLGGAYEQGRPVRSLYQYEFILRMCKELGYNYCQDIYWSNSSALPLPIQYVNKEHSRLKSAVNLELWFSLSDRPKADNRKVLVPYSDRMKKFLNNKSDFIKGDSVTRPSGSVLTADSWKDNGGSIPSNLLNIPNTDSNSPYLRTCKQLEIKPHPARFPISLIEFFIRYLTDENNLVVDIFSGSNVTGRAAENLGRRWTSFDISPEYVSTSSFRFNSNEGSEYLNRKQYENILNGKQIILE